MHATAKSHPNDTRCDEELASEVGAQRVGGSFSLHLG